MLFFCEGIEVKFVIIVLFGVWMMVEVRGDVVGVNLDCCVVVMVFFVFL